MSQTLKTSVAVIGVDIGKNSFHLVGQDRRGAIVLRRSPARQSAAVPDRHGGLRWGASSWGLFQQNRPTTVTPPQKARPWRRF
jgi:hypothetical protein